MLQGGYLNAVSVGFKPLKFARNEARRGTDYLEHDLLEFSIVPVPAHQGALVVGRGADYAAIKSWLSGSGDEPVLELADDAGDRVEFAEADFAAAMREAMPHVVRESLRRAAGRRGEPHEPLIDVDPELVGRLVAQSTRTAIREAVADAVTSTFNRLRGRVD
jgi:hypothetical protein